VVSTIGAGAPRSVAAKINSPVVLSLGWSVKSTITLQAAPSFLGDLIRNSS
jgi:hypothetical protein